MMKDMETDILLKNHSSYRIGGKARYFMEAADVEQIEEAIREVRRMDLPYFILGGGTNLLIHDNGFDGMVIKPTLHFLEREGTRVRVGAGVLMADLLALTAEEGLSGLEWAGGLPGTVGGAVRGNAGAFGGETKDTVEEVATLDISGGEPHIVRRKGADCHFGYRTSVFKEGGGREIVIETTFVLRKGDKKAIRDAIDQKIAYRKERHPMEYPNIGSIFKNVPYEGVPQAHRAALAPVVKQDPFPVVPTAYLISEAGLKGLAYGGARISEKHPNFIVNVNNARASDVKVLIQAVKVSLLEKYGVALEEEVQRV